MRIFGYVITVLILSLVAASCWETCNAAQRYVSASASSGTGSIGDPWTLAQANSNASAGDTVWMRTGTYSTYIDPSNSGSAGAYISFIKYPESGRVMFNATAYMADLTNVTYIHIEGVNSQNLSGGFVRYGTSGGGYYRFIRDSVYNVNASYGFNVTGDVSYTLIDYCYIDRADSSDVKMDVGNGDGFVIWNYPTAHSVDNVLIRRSTFKRCYHSAINIKTYVNTTNNFVIDSCVFIGNRHDVDFQGVENLLVQRCTKVYSGEIPSEMDQDNILQAVDDNVNQVIYRRNLAYADSATVDVADWESGEGMFGFTLNQGDNNKVMKNIYVYHNTIDWWCPTPNDMAGGLQFSADWHGGVTGDSVDHIRVKNNIIVGIKTTYGGSEFVVWQRDADRTYSTLDHVFAYNIFNKDTGNICAKITSSDVNGGYSLAQMQTSYASKWFSNAWTKPASWTHTSETYALASSDTGAGDAGALTTTNGGGSSSTSLILTDSRYFCDGYGLITGDTIYVSGMTPNSWASVSSINYSTHTLTLGESRTWSTGSNVYLYVNGARLDDIGAFSDAATGGAALEITSTSPLTSGIEGVAYSLALGSSGGTAPYAYDVIAGALPTGLSLSGAGIISGTPSAAGEYNFTARVTDDVDSTDTKEFDLTIEAAEAALITYVSSAQGDNTSGATLSFDLAVSGTNNCVVVFADEWLSGGTNVSSVTIGGEAMTRAIRETSGENRSETWYKTGVSSGTKSIVITKGSSSAECGAVAACFSGVNQSSPLGDTSMSRASSGNPSVTVASTDSDLVVSGVMYYNATLTAGTGETKRIDNNNSTTQASVAILTQAGAASVTINPTLSANLWQAQAVSLRPSTSVALTTSRSLLLRR